MNQNDYEKIYVYAKKYEALAERYAKLVNHFLGPDWYSTYWDQESTQEEALQCIIGSYKGVKENKINRWRRRHKKCLFCKNLRHLDSPSGGSHYTCNAKDKTIMKPTMRRICGLFELNNKF